MLKLPRSFEQYRGLRKEIYVLFFGRIVTSLGSMIWPVLTLILSQKMGMNAQRIAAVMVASSLIMIPANLAGGRIADRFNKKRVIVVCDALSIACFLISAAVPLSYVTVALFLAAGICQSMEYPSYNALIADLTCTDDRERAYSLEYLGMNLGMVLSPTIAGLLFQRFLWLSFLISGVAIGLSTLLIVFRIKDITPVEDTGEKGEYQKARDDAGLLTVLKENPLVPVFIVCMSVYYAAYGQYNFLMPLDMGRVHGEQGAVIYGTVSSLNCIIVVLCTPFITRLFRKLSDPKKLLTGECLVAVGYALFLVLLGHIPVYYAAIILFTWGEIFTTISEGPYLSTRIPASHRGRINGLSSVLGTLITGAGDLASGHIYDSAGGAAAWTLVLSMLALAGVLTAVLIARDKKAYPKLYLTDNSDIT